MRRPGWRPLFRHADRRVVRRESFVAFFARQSDYSCSGWDEGEPMFFTTDSWYRNNQRLTRAVLERYLATGA